MLCGTSRHVRLTCSFCLLSSRSHSPCLFLSLTETHTTSVLVSVTRQIINKVRSDACLARSHLIVSFQNLNFESFLSLPTKRHPHDQNIYASPPQIMAVNRISCKTDTDATAYLHFSQQQRFIQTPLNNALVFYTAMPLRK